MASSKWVSKFSSAASLVYFLLIIFQVPLFRWAAGGYGWQATKGGAIVGSFGLEIGCSLIFDLFISAELPCGGGICTTPIEVTSSQLITSDIFPVTVVKSLLYPGAIAKGLINNMTIPSWDNLLSIYNLSDIKEDSPAPDLRRLEVLTGSYFSVTGALIGLMKPGRMSMFGTLLLIWGLVKEEFIGKPMNVDPAQAVYVSPMILVALVCAFSSVKYDVKKVIRSTPMCCTAKPLKSSSKSKLK